MTPTNSSTMEKKKKTRDPLVAQRLKVSLMKTRKRVRLRRTGSGNLRWAFYQKKVVTSQFQLVRPKAPTAAGWRSPLPTRASDEGGLRNEKMNFGGYSEATHAGRVERASRGGKPGGLGSMLERGSRGGSIKDVKGAVTADGPE